MKNRLLAILPCLAIGLFVFSDMALGANITMEGDSALSWLFLFLTNDIVRTVLLIIGIAGVVIEIATVGSFGIFGVLGVLSFIFYFVGSIWAGSMGTSAILLLLAGLVLLILELFVLPGFGVVGGIGIVCLLLSLIFASPNPATAVWSVLIAIIVSIAIIWFTLKNKKTRQVWNKLVLRQKMTEDDGYVSADPSLKSYANAKGVAATILRPAGTAIFNGRRIDVVSEGEFIEPGSPVEVILIEGMRVVVKEIKKAPEKAED